ncbi:MAG: TonB-dependent receptor [Sphingobacteriaceae bacterium]|nr:TonB-dependent receptor [Sphingobacteriaceae bacterium]
MKISYFIIISLFFASFGKVFAQDKKNSEENVLSEEVEVVRPYKPILAEAVKLRRSPDLENVKVYKTKLKYSFTDKKLELSSDIRKLQTQVFANEVPPVLLNNYIKLGGGNLNTTLAEVYVNSGRDEALQVGTFFKHFSQNGKLPNQQMNQQNFTLFGRSIGEYNSLNGALTYQRNDFGFYGLNEKKSSVLFDQTSHKRFNFFEANGELINNEGQQASKLKYGLKANGYFLNDNYNLKENEIKLSGFLSKKINTFDLGLKVEAQFGNSKDSLVSVNNTILSFRPHFSLENENGKITIGASIFQTLGFQKSFDIFPMLTANYDLVSGYLSAFAGINGGILRTTYKGLTDENPYLNPNIEVKNVKEKINIAVGVNGKAGDGIGYKVTLYGKILNNQPLFINNVEMNNKFDVIYDSGNTKQIGVEGEVSVTANDYLKWNGKINFVNYEAGNETNVWLKPEVVANSNLFVTLSEDFDVSLNVVLQSESKAKTFIKSEEKVEILKGFVDFGLGANYRINKNFGLFAKVNNLFDVKYSRFLYYPTNGINIFAGLSYSFK